MRRSLTRLVSALMLASGGSVAACSAVLGLDDLKNGPAPDGGAGMDATSDGASRDAGAEAAADARQDAVTDSATDSGQADGASSDSGTDGSACVPPPSGLVSWWRGDGDLTDSVGTNDGIDGDAGGGTVSFVAGVVGQALHFDGTSYLLAGAGGLPVAAADRTIELWTRLGQAYSGQLAATLFRYGTSGANHGGDLTELAINGRTTPPGELAFTQYGAAVYSPAAPVAGDWHHVAVTVSASFASLYLDGVLVGLGALTFNTPAGTQTYIGAYPNSVSEGDVPGWLTGDVDEASVYSRALSASEIAAIYNAGSAGKCKCSGGMCASGATQCASATSVETCGGSGCGTWDTPTTCPTNVGVTPYVCERYGGAACVDPNWAEWPMPNGAVDSPPAPNLESYTDNGDGTVTDNVTELMWQQSFSSSTFTWGSAGTSGTAQSYCATLATGGHDDWRLPSVTELASIVDLTISVSVD